MTKSEREGLKEAVRTGIIILCMARRRYSDEKTEGWAGGGRVEDVKTFNGEIVRVRNEYIKAGQFMLYTVIYIGYEVRVEIGMFWTCSEE